MIKDVAILAPTPIPQDCPNRVATPPTRVIPKEGIPRFRADILFFFCSTSISDTTKLIEALRHLASAPLEEGLVAVDQEIPLPHTLPLLLTARNVVPSVISAATSRDRRLLGSGSKTDVRWQQRLTFMGSFVGLRELCPQTPLPASSSSPGDENA